MLQYIGGLEGCFPLSELWGVFKSAGFHMHGGALSPTNL